MSNTTQTVERAPQAEVINKTPAPIKQEKKPRKSRRLSQEDIEIVAALEAVRSDMEFLHNCFDQITEPILVDSLIYELKAANLKYEYYINQCKQKGIICGDIPELRG
ncbi:MAG: YaaL family protein [Firmicutes bacterium]|nr:YaaL family protein [Bacillota bacterium]